MRSGFVDEWSRVPRCLRTIFIEFEKQMFDPEAGSINFVMVMKGLLIQRG